MAVVRVPIVEDQREEDVVEVVADNDALNALAAGAGAETFACEDGFGFAVGVGVGQGGRELGGRVDVGGFHEDGELWVGSLREGTGTDEVLGGEVRDA